MINIESQTELIKKRFNRTARFYDVMDKMIKDSTRREALALAEGKVLEVGIGTGKNLPYYPMGIELTGIDFSPRMLEKARRKLSLLKPTYPVQLFEMDVQNMIFPDHSFDTVIATCVFCSVPDPLKGLKEVKRVCKRKGKIILLEHMRSDHPLLGKVMDILNPITLYLIGSNINRKTLENIHTAGIKVSQADNLMGNIFKLIIAEP